MNLKEKGEAGLTGLHFGEHLMIDGYGGSYDLLNDQALVLRCLDELPELLGMKKLAEPVVYSAPGNAVKDPGGWSGIVVVTESHISIHTFPARGFVSIDTYTCKNDMDTKLIVSYFCEKFSLQDVEINFVKRGRKYPKKNVSV